VVRIAPKRVAVGNGAGNEKTGERHSYAPLERNEAPAKLPRRAFKPVCRDPVNKIVRLFQTRRAGLCCALASDHQFAVMPPSITSSLPVTHEASSEAR
jgi:hypothetical protein